MTIPPASEPDRTVRLGKQDEEPAEPTPPAVALGPVRRSKPAAPTAAAAPTAPVEPAAPVGPAELPEHTVRLGGPVAGPEPTVHLRLDPAAVAAAQGAAGAAELTVRLGQDEPAASTVRLGPPPAGSTVQLRMPGEAVGFESATFLDPEVWTPATESTAADPAEVQQPHQHQPHQQSHQHQPPPQPDPGPVGPDGLRRFGPGVPPQAAAVWHGTAEPPRKRRRWRWLVVPLLLLLAALGYLAWKHYARPLTVSSVAVETDPAPLGCDGTQAIKATLLTDGGGGDVTYHWRRSDGTDSGELVQRVPRGRHSTELVLRWSFHGQGEMDATATLEVLTPDAQSAGVSFTYACA
ncbi:hypothetical protein [Kitasatospora sp. NPDC002040]|uniref:hypothetical protein n=1 Tax=Kitasatospora sp. NPDC002040 TaxID=3154661 RepID=UPI0033166566